MIKSKIEFVFHDTADLDYIKQFTQEIIDKVAKRSQEMKRVYQPWDARPLVALQKINKSYDWTNE